MVMFVSCGEVIEYFLRLLRNFSPVVNILSRVCLSDSTSCMATLEILLLILLFFII